MSKQILIELVGENETGYCYADLYLPASAEEIAEAKERANWNSDSTIPFEIRQRVGFSQNDVLSFTESPDGRTVLVKREKLCDDNCKPERTQQRKEETDSVTLFDFLNSLSDEQQCAALYHLSAKWSAQKGGSHAGA